MQVNRSFHLKLPDLYHINYSIPYTDLSLIQPLIYSSPDHSTPFQVSHFTSETERRVFSLFGVNSTDNPISELNWVMGSKYLVE